MKNEDSDALQRIASDADDGKSKHRLSGEHGTSHTAEQRRKKAEEIIHSCASSSAALSSTLAMIPFGDTVALSSITISMILALAELFEVKLSKDGARQILSTLAGQTVGGITSKFLLGLIPGVGSFSNSAISFGNIEAIGWRTYEFFEKVPEKASVELEAQTPKLTKAFICYSHADNTYVSRFLVHIKGIQDLVDVFVDKNIQAGNLWREEISNALLQAKVAVLFISPDFIASDFIQKYELPSLLEAAKKNSTIIFPVIVSPILKREAVNSLLEYQAPTLSIKPLMNMKRPEREQAFVQIAEEIYDVLGCKN